MRSWDSVHVDEVVRIERFSCDSVLIMTVAFSHARVDVLTEAEQVLHVHVAHKQDAEKGRPCSSATCSTWFACWNSSMAPTELDPELSPDVCSRKRDISAILCFMLTVANSVIVWDPKHRLVAVVVVVNQVGRQLQRGTEINQRRRRDWRLAAHLNW